MNYLELYNIACEKIKEHIRCINHMNKPLLVVSDSYNGLWLEHVYDAIMYDELFDNKDLVYNTFNAFIDLQKDDGQYPCFIKDTDGAGYSQLQECVSFTHLGWLVYEKYKNIDFLKKIYASSIKWVNWLQQNRMTRKLGLPEMFVGYDTGHDNSYRLDKMSEPQCFWINGQRQNASVLPKCNRAPIVAVDISAIYYGTITSIAKMAKELNDSNSYNYYSHLAIEAKNKIIELLYDENDKYFYDLDRNNEYHKCYSSSIFHLLQEGVITKEDTKYYVQIINNLFDKERFNTNYPLPAVAINDENWLNHKMPNSWGYYSQALIALRGSLYLKDDLEDYYKNLLQKWMDGLLKNYEKYPFSQELDPITGEASEASIWYSTSLLLYVYAYRKLNK